MISLPAAVFLWGAAHASFQVEGSPADSDWRRWTHTAGKVHDGTNADLATDFWNQPERDLEWVKELGANAFRFSLAWERLEPREGVFDDKAFARYSRVLDAARARGIEPVVTLLHFALPGWLADQGGLTSPKFDTHFERYAREVQKRLGTKLSYILTINEPMVQVSFGYLQGMWPPGKVNDTEGASLAAYHLAMAHARAYTTMKAANPLLKISIATHWRLFDPHSRWNPLDHFLATYTNRFFNKLFLEAILKRKVTFEAMGSKPKKFSFPGQGPLIDFLGVNYYGRMLVQFTAAAPHVKIAENAEAKLKSDMGWEVYPEGLERVFAAWKAMAPEGIPIMITENGTADKGDRLRSKFLRDHVAAALAASNKSKVPLLGYIHWSLTDNFEWSEGLGPRFGLVGVEYPPSGRAKDLKFTKRPAFYEYQKLIKEASARP
ncbi:MAG TPA: glycoside hydrolase family 1 protein [Bdellovibrionota bacterium]|jgi:beta-glucosidase|nr:glycoside hydrolase family 1 protein [Bdellovibrionota bacterium]